MLSLHLCEFVPLMWLRNFHCFPQMVSVYSSLVRVTRSLIIHFSSELFGSNFLALILLFVTSHQMTPHSIWKSILILSTLDPITIARFEFNGCRTAILLLRIATWPNKSAKEPLYLTRDECI